MSKVLITGARGFVGKQLNILFRMGFKFSGALCPILAVKMI
jgi:hypothetical protein